MLILTTGTPFCSSSAPYMRKSNNWCAMVTIVEKMATCEFYAHIYDEGLRVQLATSSTTKAFHDGLDAALKNLYAAVRAFLDKAKEYFDPENSGIVFEQISSRYHF